FSGKGEVEADQDLGAQVRAVVGLDAEPSDEGPAQPGAEGLMEVGDVPLNTDVVTKLIADRLSSAVEIRRGDLEQLARSPIQGADRVKLGRCAHDEVGKDLSVVVAEESELLVREVPEEAALGDTRTLDDVLDVGVVVAAFLIQLDCCGLDGQSRRGLVPDTRAHVLRHHPPLSSAPRRSPEVHSSANWHICHFGIVADMTGLLPPNWRSLPLLGPHASPGGMLYRAAALSHATAEELAQCPADLTWIDLRTQGEVDEETRHHVPSAW